MGSGHPDILRKTAGSMQQVLRCYRNSGVSPTSKVTKFQQAPSNLLRSKAVVMLWFSVACFCVRVSVTFHLTCVHILVPFGLLSGHLLGNSCSLG